MPKSLIIVESPAKARTLQRYLGKDYEVKASVGHIRDLPVNCLGVDVQNDFAPQYVTIRGKSKIINELKSAAQNADEIYLAPDPDREGEAIAWHIAEMLRGSKKPLHRALFHELTKKAILRAIENASDLNRHLFEAQQARRILDRLVGYQLSPLLWDKVRRGLSAGRVQSVAVRMVCDREREIEAFVSEEYWSIGARLQGTAPPPFVAQLDRVGDQKLKVSTEAEATEHVTALKQASYVVAKVEKKEKRRNPAPPFITSTLQQEASRKLRFSAKKTMTLAQRLYEGIDLGEEGPTGLITYMRTDSTRLSDEAVNGVRQYIERVNGPESLPAKPNLYKTSKSAQDAHEAIRPTDAERTPAKMAPYLDKDLLALYELIWKRFVASQMAPAIYDQTAILIEAGRYRLKATGSIVRFLGFMALYVESEDENPAAEQEGEEMTLPDLKAGDRLQLQAVLPKQHFTQPPPRYTEATLVKALEENGVGRPSTYASILSTIQEKGYVQQAKRRFEPTDLGLLVTDLLVEHFPRVMGVDFTASMEQKLDKVEEGDIEWLKILQDFYGPFQKDLEQAKQEMKSVKRSAEPTDIRCKLCGGTMMIKWGRKGEFLACEKYPECKHTQDFKRTEEGRVVPVEREEPEASGEVCDKCGRPMVFKQGRYGRFLACSGYPECRNVRALGTGVNCPEPGCQGELVQKVSKRGKMFFSCNRYPQCKYAMWDKPVPRPCPQCGSPFMIEKESKREGTTLQCPRKECGYREPVEEREAAEAGR
jgi:DNA topoisomerase I